MRRQMSYFSNLILLTSFIFFCSVSVTCAQNNRPINKDSLVNLVYPLNEAQQAFNRQFQKRFQPHFSKMKIWGSPFFNLMDHVFYQYNLPVQLKYLAVIESWLNNRSISWVGAVGTWQFMPETGRRMGLTINGFTDERTDDYAATHAAAKYLIELYNSLGDWPLVIAAYNCGPARVKQAIKKAGSHNFWDLEQYLPSESRGHVKKFIATHYYFEGGGGETTISNYQAFKFKEAGNKGAVAVLSDKEFRDAATSIVNGNFNAMYIAKYSGISLYDFVRYNPNFDKFMAMGRSYKLKMPPLQMQTFLKLKKQIERYTVSQRFEARRMAILHLYSRKMKGY